MKNVKNTVTKKKESVKQGKIVKNKPKILKKLKDVSKTEVPKIKTSIAATEKNDKTKTVKKNGNTVTKSVKKVQNVNKKQQEVVKKIELQKAEKESPKKIKLQKDKKKSPKKFVKKVKVVKTSAAVPKDDSESTEDKLKKVEKKIEKKKIKKLAQKLKKQQKKKEPLPGEIPKVKKVVLEENEIKNKTAVTADAPNNDVASTNSKVLAKKENKAKRRQQIKDQKLEERQARDPAIEQATIFVGNLPANTKRVQLIRLFINYGPINSIRLRSAGGKVLYKHKQRKEAGTLNAYLVLKDKEIASKALALNGVEFKGNHLRVTPSLKAPQTHEKDEAKRTVFVGNLKYTATEEALREIFTSCGEIDYIRCIRDGDKGCKGVAYVCFKEADAVGLALELNETMMDERPINVERFAVKKLGAKKARDAQAEKVLKSKVGAKQRIDGKKPKQNKLINNKKALVNNGSPDKKPKKNEFKGVKVDALKKKQILKKKKSSNQMVKLAKKIAPKPKI